MKKIVLAGSMFLTISLFAQTDATHPGANPLSFSAYAEGYYSFDVNQPQNNTKAAFLYNYNRHNEFNVTLAFVRANYSGDKVRGTVALGIGTYMNANYAAEPSTLKNVYEANVGFKIGKKNLWLDMGILTSHIGFESAVGKDCWNVTRSLLAENTPFFEGGARLTYTSENSKWVLLGLLLNGWQRITRLDGNSMMSFGTQVQYKPTSTTTLNYSTFIGTDKPDSARLIRIYHNLYSIFQVTKQLGITTGFDLGTEQKTKSSSQLNTVYSPVLIVKYSINNNWNIAARGEYYSDEKGILISTATPNGFKTTSFSMNFDYAATGNLLIRFEGRLLNSKSKIFTRNSNSVNSEGFFTTAVAISF